MDVITMVEISWLIKNLKNSAAATADLKHLTFQTGEVFQWSHTAYAITYNPIAKNAPLYLLHEYGHALLHHKNYQYDIDLIKMERAAWEKAKDIAPTYGICIDDALIEDSLDTYRDWLHARSRCPRCEATGIQTDRQSYECLACHTKWHDNTAITCTLRRYVIKKHP